LDELSDHLDSSQKDKLQKINKVSRRMGHMVDDFLTFLRLSRSPMKKQKVSILMLVDQIVEETKNKQAAERKVILSVSPLPDCYADLYMITDVFSRLISNALKFSAPRDPALIEIGISEQQGETCYFVRDNGVGFDMKYSGKLFGVFQRLHGSDEFEGIGMGLAIVQRIIHRHGGRIWAVSQPDQGAAVYFTLTGSVQ
jgi:light-regulated signal transduction histidine kinase (bacteriophytochrome)